MLRTPGDEQHAAQRDAHAEALLAAHALAQQRRRQQHRDHRYSELATDTVDSSPSVVAWL